MRHEEVCRFRDVLCVVHECVCCGLYRGMESTYRAEMSQHYHYPMSQLHHMVHSITYALHLSTHQLLAVRGQ